jgi:hypothetical protein
MADQETDLQQRLLAAIREAVQRQATEIAALPEWRRPTPNDRNWRRALQADGWIQYEPSRWLALRPGGLRNQLVAACDELARRNQIERIVSNGRTRFIRLTASFEGG